MVNLEEMITDVGSPIANPYSLRHRVRV